MEREKASKEKRVISRKGKTLILKPIEPPTDLKEDIPTVFEVIRDLIKKCTKSEWLGLSQYFDIQEFVTLATHRGLIGSDFWSVSAKHELIDHYRTYAKRNSLDEPTIDKDLNALSEKLLLDLNEIRRIYYFETKEPPLGDEIKELAEETVKEFTEKAKENPTEEPSQEEVEKALGDIEEEDEEKK